MSELKPCKKCGNMPRLYQPPEQKYPYGGIRSQLGYMPEPYYRCEACIVLQEAANKQRIIDNWNKSQK